MRTISLVAEPSRSGPKDGCHYCGDEPCSRHAGQQRWGLVERDDIEGIGMASVIVDLLHRIAGTRSSLELDEQEIMDLAAWIEQNLYASGFPTMVDSQGRPMHYSREGTPVVYEPTA